ncbi:S41 family peptidase [Pedobacter nototheniae]|uniref:S41 family peptidase n=1 Tax=Pedobacter nototheniae TaxID=2488994 RepID=UPI0029319CC3|nr:S41 family peptidase [Pedobacter nototheniae]
MNHALTIHNRLFTCFYVILFALPVFFVSCKKDKSKFEYPAGSNENVNTWILDSLKRYYYWSDVLPSNPNIGLSPKDFFTSVRNGADRFSYIILPNDPTTTIPNNKNFGFDYSTVIEQNTGKAIGIVKLVLKDSPASRAGLKRGDYISKINGKTLNEANAQALQQEILSGDKFTLGLAVLNGSVWNESRSVEISKGAILDQKEISSVINQGAKKIGYLYFQDFNPGLATSLTGVFNTFKNAAITELILDLRYNSGGQVSESAGVCAMIFKNSTYEKPFITYKGNKNGGVKTESIGRAATFDGTANFNTLLQNNLGLSRVYILSTGATASAAEVVINNLKPYIEVVLIGEKTRGKDEASFRIFDARVPKMVNWEMHPIVYKLFNASGNGNYSAGINPDVAINELGTLPLLPFGDTADPLIKAALNHLSGKRSVAVNGISSVKANGFSPGMVLTDTRKLVAQNSMVNAHR